MEDHSYAEILSALKDVTKKRDPRSLRLAAVVSALVEVVGGGNDEDCSPAKVYAKAVTALEGTLRQEGTAEGNKSIADSLSTQAALLELLQLTVPLVSPAILSATLPLTSRVLRAIVASVQDAAACQAAASIEPMNNSDEVGGVNAVLRRTCRVATEVLLRVDSTAAAHATAIKHLFTGTILALFRDRRPKVRKAVHGAAMELLMVDGCHSVIRDSASHFAHSELSSVRREKRQNEQLGDCLHVLGFLEQAILYLDFSKLGADMMELFAALIEGESSTNGASNFVAVVRVKESTHTVLTVSAVLSTVTAMLKDSSVERKKTLDTFAPRVLASLLQASPSLMFRSGMAEIDILQRGRTLYGQAVIASCERVVQSNPEMGCKLLPISIQMLILLSKPTDENPDDASVADVLMVEVTQLFRSRLTPLIESEASGLDKCLEDTLRCMEISMESVYRHIWPVSLQALVVLVQLVHSRAQLGSLVRDCVDSLLELRNKVPAGSPTQHAVESTFSSLVQGVGIEVCWDWIKWQPHTKSSCPGIAFERAWILSTLKTAALVAQPHPPRLAFFHNEILTMARVCDKLGTTSLKDKNFYHTRVIELWSLFSCFCVGPSDMESALPSLTTTLGRAVVDKRYYPQLVSIICGGVASLCSFLEGNHGSSSDSSNNHALSEASMKLLPVLFKIVTAHSSTRDTNGKGNDKMQVDQESHDSSTNDGDVTGQIQSISKAISSLAKFAPQPYMQNLFKKLMHRLLEEMQSESEDSERTCSLLSLSQALVASRVLDESDVAFLYRVLKPIVKNDESGTRIQKRAYKVLAEICEQYHSFVSEPDRLKELTDLLTATIMTSPVSVRQMRLKCVSNVVDGFDETGSEHLTEISKISAEILLCLKDSNAKTREAAYHVLMSIASRVGTTEVLKTFAAALGAETPHMRSAAVMAFSRLVFENAWEDEVLQAQLPSLLRTVLLLMNENSREVIKSVVGFIRICVSAIPATNLQPLLPELVGNLMTYQIAKDRFRGKIKIILKKLVKLFGYDALLPHVPPSEARLLTHMRKLEQRHQRKKESLRVDKPDVAAFDDMLSSDEEDSGGGRTLTSGATGVSRRTGLTSSGGSRSKDHHGSVASMKSLRSTAVRLPNETDGEVVDMLGAKVRRQVTFAGDQQEDDDDTEDGMMEFNDDGKLVVHDVAETKKVNVAFDDDMSQGLHKRRRYNQVGTMAGQDSVASRQKAKPKHARELGAAYKSKKAGGDVKKKNQKYEPYAYVPLDGRSYSKKNRRAAVDQMSSVVRKGGKRKRS